MDMPTLYTPNEVADYLHVSRGTIYGLLRNNEIGSVKVGRNRRFTAGHVKEYLTKRGPEVIIDKLYSNQKFVQSLKAENDVLIMIRGLIICTSLNFRELKYLIVVQKCRVHPVTHIETDL